MQAPQAANYSSAQWRATDRSVAHLGYRPEIDGLRAIAVLPVILFQSEDYFAPQLELFPLLHTWSLAVEEQYYVFFPLLLVFLARFGRRVLIGDLAAILVASLVRSLQLGASDPNAGFYLLEARFWELLVGALAALLTLGRPSGQGLATEALAWIGLVLIVGSVAFVDASRFPPGLRSLAPTLGTALILAFAVSGTRAATLLSARPIVAIGLISYSAYLWHQPLFAFARLRPGGDPPLALMLMLSIASLAIGALSWKYVERPFRDATRVPRRWIFPLPAGTALAFVAIAVTLIESDGFPGRLSPQVSAILASGADNNVGENRVCPKWPLGVAPVRDACHFGPATAASTALWGDSHANALARELGTRLGAENQALMTFTQNSCAPIVNVARRTESDCPARSRAVLDYLLSNPQIDTVILAARWSVNVDGPDAADPGRGNEAVVADTRRYPLDRMDPELPETDRLAAIRLELHQMTDALLAAGKRVILIYPVPEPGWDGPVELAHRAMAGPPAEISTEYSGYLRRNAQSIALLDDLGSIAGLVRVYPAQIFCDTPPHGRCRGSQGGLSLYADDNHLARLGVDQLVTTIFKAFDVDRNTAPSSP